MPKIALVVSLIGLLALNSVAHSQQSTPLNASVIVTEQERQSCLKENPASEAFMCNLFPVTTDTEIRQIEVQRAEAQRRSDLLKPDPRTPKFNACVEEFNANYHYVRTSCVKERYEDINKLKGWFSSPTEASEAARQNTDRRIAEMKRIADKNAADRIRDTWDKREKMTTSERTLDRLKEALSARCVYADSNHIMQSCD